jgi:murein DD-endopeptidase MepM/ murein hydrolase activator NlpD
MHNSELIVKVGDHVEKGQIISRSGSTGYSTGPHLHIALLDSEGNYVNPVDYLPEFYSK